MCIYRKLWEQFPIHGALNRHNWYDIKSPNIHIWKVMGKRTTQTFFCPPERNAMDFQDSLGLGAVVHGNTNYQIPGVKHEHSKCIFHYTRCILLVDVTMQLPMPLGTGPMFFGVLYVHWRCGRVVKFFPQNLHLVGFQPLRGCNLEGSVAFEIPNCTAFRRTCGTSGHTSTSFFPFQKPFLHTYGKTWHIASHNSEDDPALLKIATKAHGKYIA